MRLFAALEMPDYVRAALADWCEDASSFLDAKHWRFVPPHLWHLTLAFYGDVAGEETNDLAEALTDCAMNSPALSLKTESFGVFPNPRRPRVFWAGVTDTGDASDLKHLARCCRRAGHATVRKRTAKEAAFRAHITVARCKAYATAMDAGRLSLIPPAPQLNWEAERLCLFQSLLRPDGPQYRKLEAFELKDRGLYVR